jgi:hypothetical protein
MRFYSPKPEVPEADGIPGREAKTTRARLQLAQNAPCFRNFSSHGA